MKKIGEYTVRGTITSSDTLSKKIQLFDGRFDTGYRVKSFKISIASRDVTSSQIAHGMLGTEPGLGPSVWDWSDNREIAWACVQADANAGTITWSADDTVIDPDNMIIEDLYFYAYVYAYTIDVNYQIELEKYDITDWQGALTMVRNKSQA